MIRESSRISTRWSFNLVTTKTAIFICEILLHACSFSFVAVCEHIQFLFSKLACDTQLYFFDIMLHVGVGWRVNYWLYAVFRCCLWTCNFYSRIPMWHKVIFFFDIMILRCIYWSTQNDTCKYTGGEVARRVEGKLLIWCSPSLLSVNIYNFYSRSPMWHIYLYFFDIMVPR